MQKGAAERPAKHIAAFLGRNYHWFFAALASVLVLVRYVPAVYLSALNADHIQAAMLFHDVFEQGHAARDWDWGGHSDLFPDVSLAFLLDFILRNGLASLQAAGGVILAACVAIPVILYRQNGGRNAGTFAAILLLFFVLLLANFGLQYGLYFGNFLALTLHNGVGVTALGCFALCQHAILRKGYGASLFLLATLCFITSLSDSLFEVLFPIPVIATLILAMLLYPERRRMFSALIGTILIPATAGYYFATRLSPFQIEPGLFTHYNSTGAINSLAQFCKLCAPSNGGSFVVFVAMDLFFVIFAVAVVASQFFKPVEKRIRISLFMLLLFGACVIGSNWGAAILTGDFVNATSARYIRVAILFPAFFLLALLNHSIPWSRTTGRAAVAALSSVTSACVIFWSPQPSPYYQKTQALVPQIRDIMREEHIEAGLGSYWYANPVTFFSQDTVHLRSIERDGGLLHWINSIAWYSGDGASQPAPEFGLILMAKLDSDKIRRRYGNPARVIPILPDEEVWIYSPGKRIVYNPIFGALSNDPANEYRMEGDLLPFLTGQKEGNSRVARAGRDRGDFLTYGPSPYLHPVAGHYRVTIFYTYFSAPTPYGLASYDMIYSKSRSTQTLSQGPLPFVDNAPHQLTQDVVIPDDERGSFETRTRYHGSGDIGIDSIKISYLGK